VSQAGAEVIEQKPDISMAHPAARRASAIAGSSGSPTAAVARRKFAVPMNVPVT